MATTAGQELRFALDQRPNETLSGLLVTVVRTAQQLNFVETLLDGLAVKQKQYVYSVRQKVETLLASVVVGCRHTAEINTKLVPDTVAAGLFGMARFPDQSGINAFLRACGPAQVAHLEQAHARLLAQHSRAGQRAAWVALPTGARVLPVDMDQTPLVTRSTQATGAADGYMGRKRSKHGYQKSVAVLGGDVQEVLWLRLDPGNVHGQDAIPVVLGHLAAVTAAHGLAATDVLVRGDSQYGSTDALRQYQAAGHHYVVKGYHPRTARALADAVPPETVWHSRGTDSYGSRVWVAEAGVQALRGHDDPPDRPPVQTRVVLVVRVGTRTRTKRGRGAPAQVTETVVAYEHYGTDLPPEVLEAAAVLDYYNARATEESFFRTEQDAFGAHYLRTKDGAGEATFLWLLASTINLLRWTQHSVLAQTPLEHVGLTKLVTQALRLPATIVSDAHQYLVLLPETARLARQFVAAWYQATAQLPLPLVFNSA